MAATDPIKVDGLAEFSRNLKKLDADLPKALRIALNDAADVVVGYARPRVPRGKTGKAQGSLKTKSTRTKVRVSGGGRKAPYYPWLDFGGRVGKNKSVSRPFLKQGRYLYKGYFVKRAEFATALEKALINVARDAGVDVT